MLQGILRQRPTQGTAFWLRQEAGRPLQARCRAFRTTLRLGTGRKQQRLRLRLRRLQGASKGKPCNRNSSSCRCA